MKKSSRPIVIQKSKPATNLNLDVNEIEKTRIALAARNAKKQILSRASITKNIVIVEEE